MSTIRTLKRAHGVGAAAAVTLAACATLYAQNVHLKGGANAEPTFMDHCVSLEATASLSGLGNGDVLITLTARADVTSTCTNQGGNEAPGQNPAPLTVSGSQAIPEDEIKNGNVLFDVFTVAPVTIIRGAPDCANPNWTEEITDLSFTSALIVVEQPIGTPVFSVSCTFSPATVNGVVDRQDVVCQ